MAEECFYSRLKKQAPFYISISPGVSRDVFPSFDKTTIYLNTTLESAQNFFQKKFRISRKYQFAENFDVINYINNAAVNRDKVA